MFPGVCGQYEVRTGSEGQDSCVGRTLKDVYKENDLSIARATSERVATGAGRWLLRLPSSPQHHTLLKQQPMD